MLEIDGAEIVGTPARRAASSGKSCVADGAPAANAPEGGANARGISGGAQVMNFIR